MGIVKLDLNFHVKVMKNNQKISGKMDSQEDSAQLDSKILFKNSVKDFILKSTLSYFYFNKIIYCNVWEELWKSNNEVKS